MRNLLNTIPLIAAMLVGAAACDDKKTEDKKGEEKKDEPEKSSQKEDAKKEDPKTEDSKDDKVAKADVEEVDVNSLLDAPDASGVLAAEDLGKIDTSSAPVLAPPQQVPAPMAQVEWLPLPGDKLEIPYPTGWLKKKEGNVGIIASPDQKAAIIFTTVTDLQQVGAALDRVGQAIGVKDVQWKEPKQVAFGQDRLPALVRGGSLTTATGEKGKVLFAIVDSGGPEKVLAIGVKDDNAPAEIDATGQAVLLSIRKKQA